MNNRTTSGAASDCSPSPRAIQPVTRGGVATGQLRDGKGRFGGKMPAPEPRPAPVSFDHALRSDYEPIAFAEPTRIAFNEPQSEAEQRRRMDELTGIARATADNPAEQLREQHKWEKRTANNIVRVVAVTLAVFLILYFAGQFLR